MWHHFSAKYRWSPLQKKREKKKQTPTSRNQSNIQAQVQSCVFKFVLLGRRFGPQFSYLNFEVPCEGNINQIEIHLRVWETFELNQLKSGFSTSTVFFTGFDRLQTCCHKFGPANTYTYTYIYIYIYIFQVPANFFFIVMTTGQELGH